MIKILMFGDAVLSRKATAAITAPAMVILRHPNLFTRALVMGPAWEGKESEDVERLRLVKCTQGEGLH